MQAEGVHLSKKLVQVFSSGFCKISKNMFFIDYLWDLVSVFRIFSCNFGIKKLSELFSCVLETLTAKPVSKSFNHHFLYQYIAIYSGQNSFSTIVSQGFFTIRSHFKRSVSSINGYPNGFNVFWKFCKFGPCIQTISFIVARILPWKEQVVGGHNIVKLELTKYWMM